MRSIVVGTVLALAALFAVPAMAGEKHAESYPMPAAAFQAKVAGRQQKAREHMEKKAATLPATEAQALRGKFDAHAAKVNAEVAKATADGTVTKDEAQAVRRVAREGRPAHARHHRRPAK